MDNDYKIRMLKGPLNTSLFEDHTCLFLKLSDY